MHYLLVGTGGFLGALARYWLGRVLAGQVVDFPLATLVVNVSGSFLVGFVGSLILLRSTAGSELWLLLIVGFLGAFTTFSAFSLETLNLFNDGEWSRAGINVLANVVLCLLAVATGNILVHHFLK